MRWQRVIPSLLFVMSCAAGAAPGEPNKATEPDFDSLGGNTILLERARALEPDKNVSVVQERTVSRRNRVEIAPEFGNTFGGQTYTSTKTLGINLNYHIRPWISVGVKYNKAFKDLTPEGEALIDEAIADYNRDPANPDKPFPELDYVKDETLGLLNWYPFYGKLKFTERNVVHFDLYAVAGAGTVRLNSGSSSTWTAGGGIGFWLAKHLTARFEMRYQTYTAQYFTGARDLDLTIGSFQMGWLL
ncbi:MAG TPA: outer membrane beta-barrel domain-containing protein [Bdellovibrionales bacterium]|nr:outer membrane beta-barrel domain-containing protein [Bdellovibrionales bacterium]